MQFKSMLAGQVLVVVVGVVFTAPVQDGSSNNSNAVLNESASLVNSVVDLKANQVTPPETVKLESEALPSAILSIYDNKQQQSADSINEKPIIDTIREDEKYGNDGEQFNVLGRAIVNGYEAFANFLNRLIDTPGDIAKMISRSITAQLDSVGARVVGLA